MIASEKIIIVLPHNFYLLFLLALLGLEIIQPKSYVFKIDETQEENGPFETPTKAEHWFTGIMAKTSENSNMKLRLAVFLCLEVSSHAPFSSVALIALRLTHFIQILLEYLSPL